MLHKLVLQGKITIRRIRRIFPRLAVLLLPVVSFQIYAQEYWYEAHLEDKRKFESGDENGQVCLHVSSSVVGQPHLLFLERNAEYEVEAKTLDLEKRDDFALAIEFSLQRFEFIKIAEDTYKLPETSLCFLKIYWNDSRMTARFIQYYMGSPERDGVLFDRWYNPEDLTTLLNEVFIVGGLGNYASAYTELLLIHYPIRSLPPPTPLDEP